MHAMTIRVLRLATPPHTHTRTQAALRQGVCSTEAEARPARVLPLQQAEGWCSRDLFYLVAVTCSSFMKPDLFIVGSNTCQVSLSAYVPDSISATNPSSHMD